jgi:hypothetical protein
MSALYGHAIAYSENGISHSSGASLSFERKQTSYVYGDALISRTIDGTLTQYYHADGLGSVRGLSDAGCLYHRCEYEYLQEN